MIRSLLRMLPVASDREVRARIDEHIQAAETDAEREFWRAARESLQ